MSLFLNESSKNKNIGVPWQIIDDINNFLKQKRKAQDSRRLMDLQEKVEELKIENDLFKKQQNLLEETYKKSMEKFKKDNKEIEKLNRQLSRENFKLKQQIDTLQLEQEQSYLYNTKSNFQNMSYFDSINNTTICDEKRTLEQNYFTGLSEFAQQAMDKQFLLSQYEEDQSKPFNPFQYKFWNSLDNFNSQHLKHEISYSQKETMQILMKCLKNYQLSSETEFDLVTLLVTHFKEEKGSDAFILMKRMIQFQNSHRNSNSLLQGLYTLFSISDDQCSQIIDSLLLEQEISFKTSIKSNQKNYQNIFIKILKYLQEESQKNKIQRKDEITLSQFISVIRSKFSSADDNDWKWKISLPILLNKCQINMNGESLKDQGTLLMHLHAFLLNKLNEEKKNSMHSNNFDANQQSITLEQFSEVFTKISDFSTLNIQNKFNEQMIQTKTQIAEYYSSLNIKQKNRKFLIELGLDLQSRLQKCSISLIDAAMIFTSLIFQKSCTLQLSLSRVQNLYEIENRKYELNQILKSYGVNTEQYEIMETISKIYVSSATSKNEQELQDKKTHMQKRDFSSTQQEIRSLVQHYLESVIIMHFTKQLENNQQDHLMYYSENSIRTTNISSINSNKLYTENDQDSILALTQPQKILINNIFQKNQE